MRLRKEPREIQKLERGLLRGLCSLANVGEALPYCRQLSHYEWLDPEHRIVFDAIRQLRVAGVEPWHTELRAVATRMGFPEVEWDHYFGAKTAIPGDLQKWIAELRTTRARDI